MANKCVAMLLMVCLAIATTGVVEAGVVGPDDCYERCNHKTFCTAMCKLSYSHLASVKGAPRKSGPEPLKAAPAKGGNIN